MIYPWKYNIESWIFISPPIHLYQRIVIFWKDSMIYHKMLGIYPLLMDKNLWKEQPIIV